MSNAPRIQYAGAIYHVTARGNAKRDIFHAQRDWQFFLNALAETIEQYEWECHAYCLMTNHYHLLLKTPSANLNVGMQRLNSVYARQYNKTYLRTGHVFNNRYHAVLLEKDEHLVALARYIALNPVRAGIVKNPKNYRWNSYRATIGLEKTPKFLTTEWILSLLGTTKDSAIAHYKKLILEATSHSDQKCEKTKVVEWPVTSCYY